jgi:ribosome recycling factor
MFIRSVVRRNGIQLVSEQALENYNKNNNTNLTILQLARISVNNLEQHIINAWDAAYQGLVGKQTNYIRGFVVCNNCGALLSADEKELPPIKNFDEVEYCIMCPADQREEIINDIKTEVEKKNAAARNSGLTGRNLLDKEVSL